MIGKSNLPKGIKVSGTIDTVKISPCEQIKQGEFVQLMMELDEMGRRQVCSASRVLSAITAGVGQLIVAYAENDHTYIAEIQMDGSSKAIMELSEIIAVRCRLLLADDHCIAVYEDSGSIKLSVYSKQNLELISSGVIIEIGEHMDATVIDNTHLAITYVTSANEKTNIWLCIIELKDEIVIGNPIKVAEIAYSLSDINGNICAITSLEPDHVTVAYFNAYADGIMMATYKRNGISASVENTDVSIITGSIPQFALYPMDQETFLLAHGVAGYGDPEGGYGDNYIKTAAALECFYYAKNGYQSYFHGVDDFGEIVELSNFTAARVNQEIVMMTYEKAGELIVTIVPLNEYRPPEAASVNLGIHEFAQVLVTGDRQVTILEIQSGQLIMTAYSIMPKAHPVSTDISGVAKFGGTGGKTIEIYKMETI